MTRTHPASHPVAVALALVLSCALSLGLAALGAVPALAATTPPADALCNTCAGSVVSLAPPTAACQLRSGDVTVACPSDFYLVDLVAGTTYEFNTCGSICFGAAANYNSRIRVWDPSCALLVDDDNSCVLQANARITASVTGTHRVEVTGSTPATDTGTYTLGYREVCNDPIGACGSPVATLNTPTTTCQIESGSLTCGTAASYDVTLANGQTYTFTACGGATCPGANAAFDSLIELYQGAALVATNTSACGTGGEVTYATDPFSGGGTYCVRIVREAGGGAYDLGYRVACQAPSNVGIGPIEGFATDTGCSLVQTFTANSAGTGAFTFDWTITPPAGGSAVPASRSGGGPLNSDQFTTTVTGLGDYTVSLTVGNDCGTFTETVTYTLRDAKGPDLVCAAAEIPCLRKVEGAPVATAGVSPSSPAERTARPEPGTLPEIDRHEVSRLLLESPSAAEASAAIAKEIGIALDRVRVYDGRAPELFRPPGTNALSCASPCTFGSLTMTHPYYDVLLNCGDGAFTARTGASHSVTALGGGPQNVIYGGTASVPGTSDITLQVHNNGTSFLNPSGGQACTFDPTDTASEPGSVGIEEEWDVDPLVAGLQPLKLREELVAFGSVESNSGVRLTLGVTNPAASTVAARVGFRWQIDYQNATDDGPGFATVLCSPFEVGPERFTEHEFAPAEIRDFYRIQNNSGSPIFANFTSTAPIQGFGGTGTPDRLVYGAWPSLNASAWDYVATEGDVADFDSATLVYYGYLPADALVVAPGQTLTRSVVIFTAAQAQSCGIFTPGQGTNASLQVCPNACVELSATATDDCSTPAVSLASTSIGAPACAGNPCALTFPTPGTYTYTWQATDGSANLTTCTTTVSVLTAPAPELSPIAAICAGERIVLDAGASGANGCTRPLEYQFRDGAVVLQGWSNLSTLAIVPAGTTTYTVDVRCPDSPSCLVSDAELVTVAASAIAEAGADGFSCRGGQVSLDGSGSSVPGCTGGLLYEWRQGATVVRPASPVPTWSPPTGTVGTTTYTLVVTCATGPSCPGSDDVEVRIDFCLAVHYGSFQAAWTTGSPSPGVAVSWTTTSEDDTLGFAVESAPAPGGPFTRRGDLVPARGAGSAYRLLDPIPAPGSYPWYRVVEYTSNGRGDQTPAFQAVAAPNRPGTGRTRGRRR